MIIIPSSILASFHVVLAKIHGVVHGPCMYPCAHLDLVDFGQNVSTTAGLMVSCNPLKKIQVA